MVGPIPAQKGNGLATQDLPTYRGYTLNRTLELLIQQYGYAKLATDHE